MSRLRQLFQHCHTSVTYYATAGHIDTPYLPRLAIRRHACRRPLMPDCRYVATLPLRQLPSRQPDGAAAMPHEAVTPDGTE